jgi:hypothetical protein
MSEHLKKIAIFGVPRSGTSWIGEIFNSSPYVAYRFQPLFSYALKDYLTPASSKEEIQEFYEKLLLSKDTFINQYDRRNSGDYPTFNKANITHVAFKEVRYINILSNLMRRSPDLMLCLVMRNPYSVINSWMRAPREFRRDLGWKEQEEWRYALKKNMNRPEEYNGYEKWKEAANLFISLKDNYPERVQLINYGKLIQEPARVINNVFSRFGLGFTEQTLDFLKQSSNQENTDPYSVYRSKQTDDNWRRQLDPTIVEEISQDLQNTQLEVFLDDLVS